MVLLNGVEVNRENPVFTCPGLEKTSDLNFTVHNRVSDKLLFPTSQTQTFIVECKYPFELLIDLEKEEASIGKQGIKIYSEENTLINGNVFALDNRGRRFYNDSNLVFVYSLQDSKSGDLSY